MAPAGHAAAAQDDMPLRFGAFGRDRKQIADAPLDLRVSECCPTTVAVTSDGPIVADRDRSPDEVRDTYTTRLEARVSRSPGSTRRMTSRSPFAALWSDAGALSARRCVWLDPDKVAARWVEWHR